MSGTPNAAAAQITAWIEQGFALHRQGKLADAKALYEAVLRRDAKNFDALRLLGIVALDTGNLSVAVDLLGRAIKINPRSGAVYYNRAAALHGLKRWTEALAAYDKALALEPTLVEAHNNRGNTLKALNRAEEALTSYDRALTLKPNAAEVWNNRANLLQEMQRSEEALANYDKALAYRPAFPEALVSRGNVLLSARQAADALISYDAAIALGPDDAAAHCYRGIALMALHRPEAALASFDKAIALNPRHAEALNSRGNVLVELARLEDALASHQQALALEPERNFLLGNVLHTKMRLCDWSGTGEMIARAKAEIAAGRKASVPFALLSVMDEPQLHRRAAAIYTNFAHPRIGTLGPIVKRAARKRVRVGYFSADFHDHPVGRVLAEILEARDTARFEVFGFSFGPDTQDGTRKRIGAAVDKLIAVQGMSDIAAARLAREAEIDIAVDLTGYTEGFRTGIFAAGCAPIQVNYLGYPGTMAAPYIDYIIADTTVIPAERHADFAEKIVSLPQCYLLGPRHPMSGRAMTRQEFGLPDSSFVFCSFNNSYKIQPATFAIWMQLLRAVDDSVLWLREDNPATTRNLRRETEACGVAGDRLIFAQRVPLDEHLARHRLADLFLDTFPYNAHLTASDALWAGLPVLTCAGASFASRVAASLLNAVGLPELVTRTLEDYEAAALDLARNGAKLAAIRQKLNASKLPAPLFDAPRFARHLEAAFAAMHERHQAGRPPESFTVGD